MKFNSLISITCILDFKLCKPHVNLLKGPIAAENKQLVGWLNACESCSNKSVGLNASL